MDLYKVSINGEFNRFSSYRNLKLQTKNLTTLNDRILVNTSEYTPRRNLGALEEREGEGWSESYLNSKKKVEKKKWVVIFF